MREAMQRIAGIRAFWGTTGVVLLGSANEGLLGKKRMRMGPEAKQ